MHRSLALSLLILVAALGASAQHNAVGMAGISGTVRSADGQPVRDAQIEIRSIATGQTVASGYTSFNGTYEFMNVPNGQYEVVVTNGLSQATERVQLQSVE